MKCKESNKKLKYPSLNVVDLGIVLWTYYDFEFKFATMIKKKCDYKRYCNEKNSIGATALNSFFIILSTDDDNPRRVN